MVPSLNVVPYATWAMVVYGRPRLALQPRA